METKQQQVQVTGLKKFNQTITDCKTQNYLQQVLGKKSQSFVNNMTALVANSSMLQECEPITVIYAGIKATALDLPLDSNLGFAYVIPFKNNKKGITEAQFQMGYKGYVQLAMRSGQFKTINVRDVRDGEITGEDFISGEMQFKPKENRESLPVVGYVAYFRLTNGFEKMEYWDTEKINSHAMKYSQTFKSSNKWVKESSKWATDFDAMARKTVLKILLSKYAPMSVEMCEATTIDQSVIDDNGTHYIDKEPDTIEIEEADAEAMADKIRGMEDEPDAEKSKEGKEREKE